MKVWMAAMSGLLILFWSVISFYGMQATLTMVSDQSAIQIGQLAASILNHAHATGDDLAVQKTVQCMVRLKAISWASVQDSQNKILAHNRIAQIGSVLHVAHDGDPIRRVALRVGADRWGTLVFSTRGESTPPGHSFAVRVILGSGIIAWILFIGWVRGYVTRMEAQQREIASLKGLLAQCRTQLVSLEEKSHQHADRWRSWLDRAINEVPHPCFLLDHRQRLIAANRSAIQIIMQGDGEAPAGISWQEIPIMKTCGKTLERSLTSPGAVIQSSPSGSNTRLTCVTQGSENHASTCVTVSTEPSVGYR